MSTGKKYIESMLLQADPLKLKKVIIDGKGTELLRVSGSGRLVTDIPQIYLNGLVRGARPPVVSLSAGAAGATNTTVDIVSQSSGVYTVSNELYDGIFFNAFATASLPNAISASQSMFTFIAVTGSFIGAPALADGVNYRITCSAGTELSPSKIYGGIIGAQTGSLREQPGVWSDGTKSGIKVTGANYGDSLTLYSDGFNWYIRDSKVKLANKYTFTDA